MSFRMELACSTPVPPYTIVSAAAGAVSGPVALGGDMLLPASISDGNNHTSQFYLDSRGRLLEQADALGDKTTYELNTAGDPVEEVDPMGHGTDYSYDSAGDVTEVQNPDGSSETSQYDPIFHHVVSQTNAAGATTNYTYDPNTGLLLSSTDPLNNTTHYVWANGLLQSVTDPLGNTTQYQYDSDRRQTEVISPGGGITQTTYDSFGNPATIVDPLNRTTQMSYNARGELLSSTAPDGATTSYVYYDDGEQRSETNARGFTSSTTIDARGLEIAATDYLGNTSSNQYDAAGNLTSATDANQNTTSYQYDNANRQTQTTDAVGNQSYVQYNADGQVTSATGQNGGTSFSYYDALGRQILSVGPAGQSQATYYDATGATSATINADGGAVHTYYDKDGRPIDQVDALGNLTQTIYNADGDPIETIDPRGGVSTAKYNADGEQISATDADGRTTSTAYDLAGQVTSTTDAMGHTTHYGYNLAGEQTSVTDANNHTSKTVYDPAGNVIETIDANNNVTKTVFDGDNRATAVTDALGNTSSTVYVGNQVSTSTDAAGNVSHYSYDADNRQVSLVSANNATSSTSYGPDNEVLATYDGNQNEVVYQYNLDGQQVGSQLGTGAVTSLGLDPAGQQISETDPNGNVTHFLRDAGGNAIGTTSPTGAAAQTVYNQDGEAIKETNADGLQVTSTYDLAGQLTAQVLLDGTGAQADEVSFNYNLDGQETAAANSYGSYSFQYDAAGQLTQQTDPFNLTLSFAHDAAGNVTTVSDSAGGTETSVFNADNELASRSLAAGGAQARIDLTYTADGQLDTLKRYADTAGTQLVGQTKNHYNAVGNLTEEKHTNASNNTLADFQYMYDPGSRLSWESDTLNGGAAVVTTYGYDAANQLTQVNGTTSHFDMNGNPANTGDVIGTNNELLSDGNWNYQYDAAGNVIEKDGVAGGPDAGITWQYTYNNAGLMTTATETQNGSALVQETNYYDVFGNRVEQDVSLNGGTPTVTKFAYDMSGREGGSLANVWADLNASNQIVTRRAYLDSVDSVFVRIAQDGTVDFYLTDHLGSVRGLMSSTGALDDVVSYDAWGNVTSDNNPSAGDRYKFTGREFDVETGLQYNRAREYDPSTHRWMSQDPIGLSGGMNSYEALANDPVGFTDPGGASVLSTLWDWSLPGWFLGNPIRAIEEDNIGYSLPGPLGGWVGDTIGYTRNDLDTGTALSLGLTNQIPFFRWPLLIAEISDGRSMHPGAGFGEPMTGLGNTFNIAAMVVDVAMVAIPVGIARARAARNARGGAPAVREVPAEQPPPARQAPAQEVPQGAAPRPPQPGQGNAPGRGRIQVFGPGENELAPPGAITVIEPEAPNAAFIRVRGGTAFVNVNFMENMSAEFVDAIVAQARQAGARRAVMYTGEVISRRLATSLNKRASSGRTFLGGTVTRITREGVEPPRFKITWNTG